MGKSFYLTAASAVCATFLNGCSTNPPELNTASIPEAGNFIPSALPLVQQGQAYRQQQQAQPSKKVYQARYAAAKAQPQNYRPPAQAARANNPYRQAVPVNPVAPRVQHASYNIPQVNSSYTLDQDFDTWSRVFGGFRLPDHSRNPRVQQFIQSYARNPAQLSILSERASLFLHMIIEEVNRRGMPAEVALLPFVESGFDADVFSHAGAAGLWQFIPSTGRTYGLKQASNYDARMDPFAATGAALSYLQKLQREFNGDWLLALAAYNCGENCVHRAVRKARQSGLQPTFWNLSLPKETMNYVPRLLAFKELIGRSQHYGIRLPMTPNSAKLAQLRTNKPVDLRQVAIQAGLPANRLTDLNPCFRTGITTPEHSNRIILPREYANQLAQVIRNMPAAYAQPQLASWRGSARGG